MLPDRVACGDAYVVRVVHVVRGVLCDVLCAVWRDCAVCCVLCDVIVLCAVCCVT